MHIKEGNEDKLIKKDVIFFLRLSKSDELTKASESNEVLKTKICEILKSIRELNFDEETIEVINNILHRPNAHKIFHEYNKLNEKVILGRICNHNKPVFELSGNYDSSLVELEKWINRQRNMEILRVENGNEEKVVSFEEFIEEMQKHPWNCFGIPKKWNPKEDTIWDVIRLWRGIF